MALDPEASALKKVRNRLIPFVALLYFAAFIDRVNVSFAAAQMNRDLAFSAYVYGLGAGIWLPRAVFERLAGNRLTGPLAARHNHDTYRRN